MRTVVVVALCLVIGIPTAQAESLRDAIMAAWAHDPDAKAAAVDSKASKKTANALDSLFPSGPVLNGQYLDDHFIGSKVGYTTYQGSVSLPLWLPGQGTASVKDALASVATADARLQVHRLLMAVRVLDVTSASTILKNEIFNLEKTRGILSQTLESSQRALTAGEISATDHEAVVAEYEDIESAISDKQQQLATFQSELQALTGSDVIPELNSLDGRIISLKIHKLDPEKDPRVRLVDARLKKAQAAFDVAKHSYMPNPTIGVQISRQEQYQSPWDTQVGVVFQAALPSRARNTPMLMKTVSEIGAARRDAELARRKVRVEYARLRSQIASSLSVRKHAETSKTVLLKRADQLESAWRTGEVPLIEYIRARRGALEAEQRMAKAEVVWHAALVRLVLMMGETL
ncbi:MAG: TolC family protein [Acetobacter malorum]|uniref:TolC family protein n=1 Tax=Acetobacter malorum TaxID=178901 RepID=UPI0039EC74E9